MLFLDELLNESLSSYIQIKTTEENVKKYKEKYPRLRHVRTGKNLNGILLIDKDDKFVGILQCDIEKMYIVALEVSPEYRGKGIASDLLDYALNKLNVYRLTVNKNNKSAIKLYEKKGYKTFKETDTMLFMSKHAEKLDESVNQILLEAEEDNEDYTLPEDEEETQEEPNTEEDTTDEGNEEATDDTTTEDDETTADEEESSEYTLEDDGTEETTDDTTTEENPDETAENDGTESEDAENSIENDLKVENLFKDYKLLYNGIMNFLKMIKMFNGENDRELKIYNMMITSLGDLRNVLYDYILKVFTKKSYIENLTNLYEFQSILELNKKLLDDIKENRQDDDSKKQTNQ